jgi:hypothetical protein
MHLSIVSAFMIWDEYRFFAWWIARSEHLLFLSWYTLLDVALHLEAESFGDEALGVSHKIVTGNMLEI